jgi:hypothetical protein
MSFKMHQGREKHSHIVWLYFIIVAIIEYTAESDGTQAWVADEERADGVGIKESKNERQSFFRAPRARKVCKEGNVMLSRTESSVVSDQVLPEPLQSRRLRLRD